MRKKSSQCFGERVVMMATRHLGEPYALGANVPFHDPAYKGPWDCAEFASWLVYQAGGGIYGCIDNAAPLGRLEPFSGAWVRDATTVGFMVPIDEANEKPGYFLIRRPRHDQIGHVALTDGHGGTIEAHSAATGVCRKTVANRLWDYCVRIPGVAY